MTPQEALEKLVYLIREYYHIDKYPNVVDKLCNECDIETFRFAMQNNLGYEQIHLTKLGLNEPFHRASLLGFNTDDNFVWYLIDPTYGQFFEDKEFKTYMFKTNPIFCNALLNDGFIKLSIENLLCYINGFIHCYNKEINPNTIYENLYNLLKSTNIINEVDNHLYTKK